MDRVNAKKEHMGLTTWKDAPDGKIRESDVVIAKNYLSGFELSQLERMVSQNCQDDSGQTGQSVAEVCDNPLITCFNNSDDCQLFFYVAII